MTGSFRAVKVVRREDFERERTFEREFEGIQRYEKVSQDHPGLVDVLHVGRNDEAGYYYYVMELADDVVSGADIEVESYEPRTLASDLKTHRLRSVGECVEVGAPLAEALGHLHAAKLTHRDVKPSNIIFVKGVAKLADVGLVASSGQRTYVGTEGYVPPEGPGTASADLYSLAMVLYEMGTGKDRLEFPELPTNMELPPTVNRDEWRALNAVVCRAGAPDPRRRFESAEAFAQALRRITQPVSGRQNSWGKLLRAAAMLMAAAVLGAAGYSAYRQYGEIPKPAPPVDLSGNQDSGNPGSGENGNSQTTNASGDSPDTNPSTEPVPLAGVDIAKLPDAFGPEFAPIKPRIVGNPSNSGGSVSLDNLDNGNRGGVVFTDMPGPPLPPEKTDEPPPPPPKARLKITQPTGAAVWFQGQQIGVVPTDAMEFDPGLVRVVLKAPGHHDYTLERDLPANKTQYETDIQMLEDLSPVPGEPWTNSVGMEFEAVGRTHISVVPISQDLFDRFAEEARYPVSIAVPAAEVPGQFPASPIAAQIDEKSAWAFCDWMTKLDRNLGYLDDGHFHHPQPAEVGSPTFYCRIENQFGNFLINSEPSQARVYRDDGTFLGKTPLQMEHQRVGLTQLKLKLSGYHDEPLEFTVRPSDLLPQSATLKRDDTPIFTESYTNSLGMSFMPVKGFLASAFETRVRDYQAFLDSHPEGIEPPNVDFQQGPDHPVAGLNLPEARAFCDWLTEKERKLGRIEEYQAYRLPHDLEWSAMAGLEQEEGATPEIRDVRKVPNHFPWGNDWPPPPLSGNFADIAAKGTVPAIIEGYDDTYEKTAPVGSFDPNPYGLHDLAGNVWEWIDEPFSGEGSENGLYFVRGGGWSSAQKNELLTSYRKALRPQYKRGGGEHGFRCVLVDTRTNP
ncbi:MAG: SUMF1/EgtB/PvdO family nonheme iron enzyme [Verrucomicrobiae bacterium]|nr:SUMF1/EgtB/PvdO family nonheme iron enzyme [Verrucomicrobiae bacterium]